LFAEAGRQEDRLFFLSARRRLDPENLSVSFASPKRPERFGKSAVAAKAFLRTAQLATSAGTPEEALLFFERAHNLRLKNAAVALLYAEATLRTEMPSRLPLCLSLFAAADSDATFWKRSPMP